MDKRDMDFRKDLIKISIKHEKFLYIDYEYSASIRDLSDIDNQWLEVDECQTREEWIIKMVELL